MVSGDHGVLPHTARSGRCSDSRTPGSGHDQEVYPDSLSARFSIVQVAMLPIQPGMAQFMGENIATACHGKPFSDVYRFCVVVPDAVGIRISAIHI